MVRIALAVLFALTTVSAEAADRQRLGYGRLLTNDTFGDTYDRWRTGSLAASRIWGPEWTGRLPSGFGDVLELRWGLEAMAPENIQTPAPLDRPFAGSASVGLHTHFATRAADFSVGADLVFTGPSTQIDELQDIIHDILDVSPPSDAVVNAQIGNGIYPTFVLEAAREFELGTNTTLRPFFETRAGAETYARVGFDLTIGSLLQGDLLVRDPVSGHRYRVVRQDRSGFAFVAGADIAYVADSVFLPESRGLQLSDSRQRVRAGMHWQNQKGMGLFYGLTWLGKEFETQRDDQLIGSIRFFYRF